MFRSPCEPLRSRLGAAICAALLFPACNGQDPGGDESAPTSDSSAEGSSEDESGTETGSEQEPQPLGVFAESCELANALTTGHYPSSLRGRTDPFGGACGLGGPQVFFAVDFDQDADLVAEVDAESFSPRLELLSAQCVQGLGSQCSESAVVNLSNVAAGTRLIGSVGIDPDDPALDSDDPLAFELRLEATLVFAEGQVCGDHLVGRCAGGTVCSPDAEGVERCLALEGDDCARALPLVAPDPGFVTELSLDLDELLVGDRHSSSCATTSARDFVYRIDRARIAQLAALPGEHRLEISSADAGIGVAVRGPGCLLERELACAQEISDTPVSVDLQPASEGPDGDLYLLVELPDEPSGVISVALAVVDA